MARFRHAVQRVHEEKTVPGDSAAVAGIRREIDIRQDQIGLFVAGEADRSRAVFGGQYFVTLAAQSLRERLENDQAVIDNQDLLAFHSSPARVVVTSGQDSGGSGNPGRGVSAHVHGSPRAIVFLVDQDLRRAATGFSTK